MGLVRGSLCGVAAVTATLLLPVSLLSSSRADASIGRVPAGPSALPLVSHDGFRPIKWVLDPEEPAPTRTSKSIHVAIHERACTGGRNPIPHLQRPEVRYLKQAVVITLWIEVLEGPHTCPGNPIGRLKVKLPAPLGPRQLYDGSADPPRRVKPGDSLPALLSCASNDRGRPTGRRLGRPAVTLQRSPRRRSLPR